MYPLAFKPGFFANGTPYSAAKRWTKGNLVRWQDGAIRPFSGWQALFDVVAGAPTGPLFPDPSVEAPRGMFRWSLLDGDVWTVVGTNASLFAIDKDGFVYDITPAGFIAGDKDAGFNDAGYGLGLYGRETYGTPRQNASKVLVTPQTWRFDTWGQDLIAAFSGDDRIIYQWTVGDPAAVAVANAPLHTRGVAVTPERILISIGDKTEARLVQWSDREDNTNWTPAVDNHAGSQILAGKGDLRAIVPAYGGYLILSNSEAYSMNYIGPPYIFGFSKVDDNTTLRAPKAVASIGGAVIWWGEQSFWIYDGSRVTVLPCEVMDYLLADVDPVKAPLTEAVVDSRFKEIRWHYTSRTSATGENDSYVIYNYVLNIWYYGRLDRSTGVEAEGDLYQWQIDPQGSIYEHEVPSLNLPVVAYAETGPLEIGNGEQIANVAYIYPDTPDNVGEDGATVTMTLLGRDFPNAQDREYGPYSLTKPTPTRARGRELRVRVNLGQNSRLTHGIARLDIRGGGGR